MVNFKTFRKGYPFVKPIPKRHLHARAANPCTDPAFYKSPTAGTTLSSTSTLTISWDTSPQYSTCLSSATQLDIYLLSPQVQNGDIKLFSPVPFSPGTYSHSLDPSWWNLTTSVQLQIVIVPSGTPRFLSPIALGPTINVTYDPSVAGAVNNDTSPDPALKTSGGVAQSGSLPKGSIAAAILLPIIVIILALILYVKISRKKQEQKRKRWSTALDAKMTRISGDWQSMTAQGAQAAFRQSTASGAGMRMSTVFAQEVGVGIRPSLESRVSMANLPYMNGRPSGETATVGTRNSRFNPGERSSRISFAADTNASRDRLSTYSQTRLSRAYHIGSSSPEPDVPPIPQLPVRSIYSQSGDLTRASVSDYGEDADADADQTFSPTQTQGPVVLTNDDIHHMDIAPALSLMRTGSTNPAAKSADDLLLSPPVPPTPTYNSNSHNNNNSNLNPPLSPLGASPNAPPLSPIAGAMPMHAQAYMSPDQLLRRYAEMRAGGAKSPNPTIQVPGSVYPSTSVGGVMSPTSPVYGLNPMPMYTSNGMRNLTGDGSLSYEGGEGQYASYPPAYQGHGSAE